MAKRRGKKKTGSGRPRKKKKKVESPPVDLPDHLMEVIFQRLPPKSLAVSRCVSPSWNNLISSPAFARRYDETKAAEATSGLVRFVSPPLNDGHTHRRITMDATGENGPFHFRCAGCPRVFSGAGMPCHGMVLAGRPCRGEFFVCNPSTGGVLRILPRRPPLYFYSAGLGYDEAAGKLKAVVLEVGRGVYPQLLCRVFTVGQRCRWRWPCGNEMGPVILQGASVSPDKDPVFADGRLHWMPSKRALNETYSDSDGILAFVLSGEFFRIIPMPAFTNGSKRPIRATLTELNSRLCLVRDLRSQMVALFDVWMLHDESWSLDRRLDLTSHLCKELTQPWIASGGVFVLRYVGRESPGHSRKILLATTTQRVYMYEPDTKELRTVATGCGEGHMRLVLYQESLAQVAGMKYDKQEIKFKFCTRRNESGFRT
jgi:F-box interacting protein